MTPSIRTCGLLVGLAIAFASPAAASVTVYNIQADFDAATSGVTTFGFTNVSGTPPGFDITSNPVTISGVTFTNDVTPADVDNGGSPIIFVIDSAATPTYGVDFLSFQNTNTGMTGSISSAGFTAFAFHYGSYVNVGASATLTLSTGESFVITPADAAQFVGFTSDTAITSISFDYPDSYAFDILDVSYGNAGTAATVPEPAAWALLLVGFGGMGAMIRRRRTAQAA